MKDLIGKIKVLKSEYGYWTKTIGRNLSIIGVADEVVGKWIQYSGYIKGNKLIINGYLIIPDVKTRSLTPIHYGCDMETGAIMNNTVYLPPEINETMTPDICKAYILCFCASARNREFVYDSTRDEQSLFADWLLNDETKTLRFYNLGFDGKFVLWVLLQMGFKEVDKWSGGREFICLKNEFGKIFGIYYRYPYESISGLGYEYISSEIYDTYNLTPNMSLDMACSAYNVLDDKNKPIKKLEFNFTRAETYDRYGLLSDKIIKYCMRDAMMARRLYTTLVGTLDSKKKYLTIGSCAWTDLLNRCFKGKLKAFKEVTGDIPVEMDKTYRPLCYRGGYGLLNDNYHEVETPNVTSVDYVSMYPYLMKEINHPIGVPKIYNKYKKPTAENPLSLHICKIYEADILPGYFPLLIKGTKSDMESNYIWSHHGEFYIGLWEEYGCESEYSIIKRTYNLDYEVIESLSFMSDKGIFDDYVDHWFNIKQKSEGALRQTSKLMLNNAYGKIGENPIRKASRYVIDDGIMTVKTLDDETISDSRNVFIASNITHKGRVKLWLDAERIGFDNVLLMATDAITYVGEANLDISKELGHFDIKCKDVTAWMVGEKAYQILDGEEVHTTCAGMTEDARKSLGWKELRAGLEYEILKKKSYEDGVILTPQKSQLKERIKWQPDGKIEKQLLK